jgi:hypothetical protein
MGNKPEKKSYCTVCEVELTGIEAKDGICFNCEEDILHFGDDNGPTGHGDICMSDADPGL